MNHKQIKSINLMLQKSKAFSGFSVNDLQQAKVFYGQTLGLIIKDHPMGILEMYTEGNNPIIIYPKPDHEPATFTILNFPVDDIQKTVAQLKVKGIVFEQFTGDLQTDTDGIHRHKDHQIAWFRDPAGNVLSVIEDKNFE